RFVEPLRHTDTPRGWDWWDQGAIALATLTNLAGAAILWLRPHLSLGRLRALEVASVASTALALAGVRYAALAAAEPGLPLEHALLLNNMAWYFTLALYGLIVPNTWRRCVAVLACVAALPVAATLLAARASPAVADRLPMLLGTTAVGLFMTG